MTNLELLQKTYIDLADCYDVMKFDKLTPEEEMAADKLKNFCLRVIPTLNQFSQDGKKELLTLKKM